MRLSSKILSLVALVTVAASSQAFTFKSVDLGRAVTLNGSYCGTVFAGRLNFSDTKYGNVKTYCVDLFTSIRTGQTYPVSVVDSQTQTAALRRAGNIVASGYSQANSADAAAGLQLAVWKTLYDGSNGDFTSGKIRVSGASKSVLSYASKFYSYANTVGNARMFKAKECNNGQSQMQAVPEPTSMAALALGAGLVARRRKKKAA